MGKTAELRDFMKNSIISQYVILFSEAQHRANRGKS
jgi:hypothetical protein